MLCICTNVRDSAGSCARRAGTRRSTRTDPPPHRRDRGGQRLLVLLAAVSEDVELLLACMDKRGGIGNFGGG